MVALLARRNFALLWLAGLIDIAGDWILIIGLPIYVYQLTGSTLATGGMLIASMAPRVLLGSVAGVFVDRWDRPRTLVLGNGLLALALLPLLAVHSAAGLAIVYVVAGVEGVLAQFVRPAKAALLPNLVEEADLVPANALNGISDNLARLVGPALGGAIAAAFGIAGVALGDAASFVVAALLTALIGLPPRPAAPEPAAAAPRRAWAGLWTEWVSGLRIIRQERPVAVIFAILAITSLGEGVMAVLFVAFVNRVIGGGAPELGWLMSAQAVGGLLGSLVVGPAGRRLAPAYLIGLGGVAFGLVDLAIFNNPRLAVDLALMVLVGVPGIAFGTGITALLQMSVPDAYRGRVFGALGTTAALLSIAGTGLGGAFADTLGIVPILNLQGAGYVVAGILALALLPRRHAMPAPAETVRVIPQESAARSSSAGTS